MARKTASFDTVREVALTLPDVQDASGDRGVAFKVRGKLLACTAIHSSAEPGSLAVHIDSHVRAQLIASEPEVYYVTPHYESYPMVLLRLARINRRSLRKVLETAWLFVTSTPARRSAKRRSTAARRR